MKIDLLNKLIKIMEVLDDEIKDSAIFEDATNKTIEALKKIDFSPEDIISAAIDGEIDNTSHQMTLFNYLKFQETIFKVILDEQLEKMENDLKFILFDDSKLMREELALRKKRAIFFLKIFQMTSTMIEQKIKELRILSDVSPTIDRKLKGKSQKSKKAKQLDAEELAKVLWAKAPEITQENMAYQIKDKLDLTQTIQTIIRWIKPHQPPK
ncbi:hypothetical protein RFF30_10165 [Pasteurella multocida]|uniref:Uncharacterized protein n=2 Tax=Pasteurella TaxID=745 RepID=A0ABW4NV08_9PAST|nr:hypothetical protein [Pasteurella multocida]WRJ98859.1 hypothetical protein RFF30_10165 [Pasteurella multocida]HEP1081829.1 hypothetical protein [Pasteurella multocida]